MAARGTSPATLAMIFDCDEALIRAQIGESPLKDFASKPAGNRQCDSDVSKPVARIGQKRGKKVSKRRSAAEQDLDAAQIADWLRHNEVTRCPTRYAMGAYTLEELIAGHRLG